MSIAIRNCVVQFTLGIKDSIYGILCIYSLDKKIQQDKIDRQNCREAATSDHKRFPSKNSPQPRHKQDDVASNRMISRVLMSSALSAFVWLSICAFTQLLLPTLHYLSKMLLSTVLGNIDEVKHASSWHFVETSLHYTFSALWVLPLYIISKVINLFWFADVSTGVYKFLYGKSKAFPSFGTAIADLLYGVFVESIFLLQAYTIKQFPLKEIANVIYCIHLCLLYALYAFEYKWFHMGMELNVRLQLIDKNWPYFFGFGLPLFAATNITFTYYQSVISTCIFSILFPFFIVSGTRASVPRDNSAMKLRIFEPSTTFCSYLFRTSMSRL